MLFIILAPLLSLKELQEGDSGSSETAVVTTASETHNRSQDTASVAVDTQSQPAWQHSETDQASSDASQTGLGSSSRPEVSSEVAVHSCGVEDESVVAVVTDTKDHSQSVSTLEENESTLSVAATTNPDQQTPAAPLPKPPPPPNPSPSPSHTHTLTGSPAPSTPTRHKV